MATNSIKEYHDHMAKIRWQQAEIQKNRQAQTQEQMEQKRLDRAERAIVRQTEKDAAAAELANSPEALEEFAKSFPEDAGFTWLS